MKPLCCRLLRKPVNSSQSPQHTDLIIPFSRLHSPSILADCGQRPAERHERAVGAGPAQRGEWPWVGSLQYKRSHRCGAALVHSKWLLTAAQCFNRCSSPAGHLNQPTKELMLNVNLYANIENLGMHFLFQMHECTVAPVKIIMFKKDICFH